MTTLREVAQMALDAMLNFPDDISDDMFESIKALRAALAQPPCATGAQCVGGKCERCAVQPEQEPQETIAKWIKANTEHKQWYICPKCSHQTPRWKDEWVGLTDEEIMKITGVTSADSDWNVTIVHKWIRAIEAKLREKNA